MLKIEDDLWTARYLGLFNYNQEAAKIAEASISSINNLLAKKYRLKSAYKKLKQLQIEGYNLLVFKILFNQKKYNLAQEKINEILAKKLSLKWKNKFMWLRGMYFYLLGNKKNAVLTWKKILSKTYSNKFKEQILFWLAKTSQKTGDYKKQNYYTKELK